MTFQLIQAHPELFAVMCNDDFDLVAEAKEIVVGKARMDKSKRTGSRHKKDAEVAEFANMLAQAGIGKGSMLGKTTTVDPSSLSSLLGTIKI